MDIRSVSRCVAIAAHGKRCQQSPFRGSPYCWHHTQSRKIWAPSRPLGSSVPGRTPIAAGRSQPDERRSGADRRAGRAAEEAAGSRLADALGPERVEELLDFLEGHAEGAYLLVRDETGLVSERSVAERRESRHRRTASG